MKKILTYMANLWPRCYNALVIRYRKIQMGKGVTIYGRLRVFGHGTIRIGDHVTINSSLSSNPIGGDDKTVLSLLSSAVLTIGDYTGISNASIVCHERITIGSHVTIGGSTKIYDTDFHSLDYEKRRDYWNEIPVRKPVTIGDDVFIGANCIILKGVTIGDRSIIGAGSVVTKNVPADEVWAGNPARRIRSLTKTNMEN